MSIAGFTGTEIWPDAEGFAEVASSYGAGGAPAVVLRPGSASDVAAALRHAADQGLPVAVRSGGHSAFATLEDGVLIDLQGIHDVEILGSNRVRIGSGAIWGDVARALQPHGLALSSGDTTSVGVGGLTLGGGIGWMVRQHGLALDSLVEAEVVLASGEIVTANSASEPELFWAVRGGGGNFGVVTRFTFQAHPLGAVIAGAITLDPDALPGSLRGWRDVMRDAPRDLNTTFLAMPAFGPEMPASTMLAYCFASSDRAAATAALAPLLQIPGVLGHTMEEKPYADVLEDPHPPEGEIAIIGNNTFADDFTDELIDLLARAHSGFGAAVLMIRYLRGALNEVPVDATAFAHRKAEVLIISIAFLPPDAVAEAEPAIGAAWATLAPHTVGLYGNFTERATPEVVGAMYPPGTAARLREAKRRYDPRNLFAHNQNIAP